MWTFAFMFIPLLRLCASQERSLEDDMERAFYMADGGPPNHTLCNYSVCMQLLRSRKLIISIRSIKSIA
jgi:hypothetical protein